MDVKIVPKDISVSHRQKSSRKSRQGTTHNFQGYKTRCEREVLKREANSSNIQIFSLLFLLGYIVFFSFSFPISFFLFNSVNYDYNSHI